MKIYLTEVLKDNKMLVGPYIKAQDIEEAIEIADMYAEVIVGELYELKHELPPKQETIH